MASSKKANAALVTAVRVGDLAALHAALCAQADPNVYAGYESVLSAAANYRPDEALALEMTRTLLDAGADPNARHSPQWDDRPIFFVAGYGHEAVARVLFDRGGIPFAPDGTPARNIDGETLLAAAARAGHLWLVEACLAAGLRPDDIDRQGSTPLHYAMYRSDVRGIRAGKDCAAVATILLAHGALLEHHRPGNWGTALHWAAEWGDPAGVRCLLAHGADPEAATAESLKRPLHGAAERGPVGCVQALLDAGASVTATTRRGETALHLAGARTRFKDLDHDGVIEALVAAGSDLHGREGGPLGWTPLGRALSGLFDTHNAVELTPSRRSLLETFVRLGSPLDGFGSWGAALVHVAARCDDPGLLAAALAKGASVDLYDGEGYTALHLAARYGGAATVRVLLEAGADRGAGTKTRRTVRGVVLGKGWTAEKVARAVGRDEIAALL